MKSEKPLDYKKAGVNIDEGARLVRLIKPAASRTSRKEVLGGLGGFGAFFSARFKGIKDPVLVSSTDGVGTKLCVAFMAGRHSTIGIDLVAMCVNDILTCGAEPLFFLDYFSTGRLDARMASSVIKGVARGCRDASCSLIGGETAEMPGLYNAGEYDLAGFAVGVVERKRIIDGRKIRAGDALIGLASSGLHSNGFSLARKVLFERLGLTVKTKPAGMKGRALGPLLLTPTRIYVRPVLKVLKRFTIRGMAHITGGGLTENTPRMMPEGLKAVITKGSWPVSKVFRLIQDGGSVGELEMLKTFNCGIGMVVAVENANAGAVVKAFEGAGERAYIIGEVARRKAAGRSVEFRGGPLF